MSQPWLESSILSPTRSTHFYQTKLNNTSKTSLTELFGNPWDYEQSWTVPTRGPVNFKYGSSICLIQMIYPLFIFFKQVIHVLQPDDSCRLVFSRHMMHVSANGIALIFSSNGFLKLNNLQLIHLFQKVLYCSKKCWRSHSPALPQHKFLCEKNDQSNLYAFCHCV